MLEDRYITREEVHCDIMLILSFPFDQLFQTIFFCCLPSSCIAVYCSASFPCWTFFSSFSLSFFLSASFSISLSVSRSLFFGNSQSQMPIEIAPMQWCFAQYINLFMYNCEYCVQYAVFLVMPCHSLSLSLALALCSLPAKQWICRTAMEWNAAEKFPNTETKTSQCSICNNKMNIARLCGCGA